MKKLRKQMNWHYAQIKNCNDRIQVKAHQSILKDITNKTHEVLGDKRKRDQQSMADQASNLSAKDFWRKMNARKGPRIAKDIDNKEFEEFWSNLFKHDKEFKPEYWHTGNKLNRPMIDSQLFEELL